MAKRQSVLADTLRLIPGYDPFATAGDCWMDEEAAQKAIDFFPECLCHVKGELAGKPFRLEPWQQAVVGNVFGWKRPDGTRRYREAFVFVPRKNGKTAMAAGIVLFVLFCDGEPGAELYSAAADREQASLVFDQAKGMVLHEPELEGRAKVYTKAIVYESQGSAYKAISADAATKHGYNTHLAIVDELHAQPNRDLVDVLMTSTGARRQPLVMHITTSDFERESICNEKHEYACKVRDGIIDDPSFLPVIYEAQRDDDWTDPGVWAMANPNLGVSVSREYLERECKRAKETPTFLNTFKRLHLNIRTESDVAWLPIDAWDRCKAEALELGGRKCWGGLDLSSNRDLTAFALAFPLDDGKWALKTWFWIPKDNARKRERDDRVPYITWSRQGHIKLTEGNVVDYDVVKADIAALHKRFNICQIGVDRWQATHITTQLQGDGFDMVPFGQGFASMSAPSKEFEKLVMGGQMVQDVNPVMRWCISNTMVETDAAGNIKPSKKKSTERIDGTVAGIMAVGCGVANKGGPSVYNSRGLTVI